MSDDSGGNLDAPTQVPREARARGELRIEFAAAAGRTEISRLYETGGLRARRPNVASGCEAVIVNTAGGVAGGDHARIAVVAGEDADATVTTVAAEKIYRSEGDPAHIEVFLTAHAGARLEWLPQETILFNKARLSRRLDVDMEATAALTVMECLVFGRLAMGEAKITGALHDCWRVRRAGKLIFAEDARYDGDVTARLDRPALGNGARASALFLHVASDAEKLVDPIRAALAECGCEWGASAWNGMAVARLLSPSPEVLRLAIVRMLQAVRGRGAPRVWS